MVDSAARRPRVVVIGAGFGGLSAAKALAREPFDITLVDRLNYHLFQPLLYQVATAALSPADIATAIRAEFTRRPNVDVILADVTAIDVDGRAVVAEGERIVFDYLVVATGARQSYFGHDDWAPNAPGLKSIDDATALRARILLAFERAEIELDPEERRRLMNFVVVGGGPTGVELAGAIAELSRHTLRRNFRAIDPGSARIVLVEGGPRVLGGFAEELSRAAETALENLGVEVRTGTPVTGCDALGVAIGADRIESRTIVWAAGVEASPAGNWLAAKTDRAGRIEVDADLSLPDRPHIFVIGDTSTCAGADGRPLPGLAAVAKQQGAYVARAIAARAAGRPIRPFEYRDYGTLAVIGRSRAVAEIGGFRISGFPAWLLWSCAHIFFLIGFRNRLVVMTNWAWSFVTGQRGARLITGIVGARLRDLGPAASPDGKPSP